MITLKLVGDDYYDAEDDCYVMTIGASINCLQTNVMIHDDGRDLECYLWNVVFLPSQGRGMRDKYLVKYKVY